MPVGGDAWQYALRIFFRQMAGFHHFRGNKVRCADHVWGVFTWHHQPVDVDDTGVALLGVDQHVFIAQIAMAQASGVHTPDCPGQQQADLKVIQGVAAFARIQELVLVIGAGKPFTFLLAAFNPQEVVILGAVLKEEVALVGGHHDADLAVVFHYAGGPTKQPLPVIATGLLKDVLPVAARDHLNALFRLLVLRLFIERHYV
ncbi:hypothetical protein D3C79_469450 [compost metagenome]